MAPRTRRSKTTASAVIAPEYKIQRRKTFEKRILRSTNVQKRLPAKPLKDTEMFPPRRARIRRNSSSLMKENVSIVVAEAARPLKIDVATTSTSHISKEEVPVPSFRLKEPLAPIRWTKPCEHLEDSAYHKMHDKRQKEERQNLRRDRIWRNEERVRARLLRLIPSQDPLPDVVITVHRKI